MGCACAREGYFHASIYIILYMSMVAIPRFETVPYYVGTFVLPVGTYSQVDYAKNSMKLLVAVA